MHMPAASEVSLNHLSPTLRLRGGSSHVIVVNSLSVFRVYIKFPNVIQQFGESDNEKLIHLFS